MAKGKGGSKTSGTRSDRVNGKAAKQQPGEPGARNNGKTKGGYSEQKLLKRAAIRASSK